MGIMWRGFYALSLLYFAQTGHATIGSGGCGEYELRGTIDKNPSASGFLYIVNKGTASQYQLVIPIRQEPKIAPYINRSSRIRASLAKRIENFRGEFSSIQSISLAVSDPMGLSGERPMVLVAETECAE